MIDHAPRASRRTGLTHLALASVVLIGVLAGCGKDLAGTVEFQDTTTTAGATEPGPTTSTLTAGLPATTIPASAGDRLSCRSAEALAAVEPTGFVVFGPLPRPEPPAAALAQVPTSHNHLTLSFDVEQDPTPVPALLEVLASHSIRTTFFVLGSWAEENPDLVRAIQAAGHEIGSHSYANERMGEWESEAILDDLLRAEVAIASVTGHTTTPWFRPPFGDQTDASVQTLFEAGWTSVTWSASTDDSVEGTPAEIQESICADLLAGAEPGAILVSHTFNPQTPAAVDRFIREMHDRDYVFVPLSVLTASDPAALVFMPG